jgi:hypothetical protein
VETVGGLRERFHLDEVASGLKLPWAEAQSAGAGSM